MLITISDYCAQRNVSKQFVYEYIKKGKLTVLELPTFIEFKGEKVQLGMQKMLEVPELLAPKAKDKKPLPPLDSKADMGQFIKDITDVPFLQDFYRQLLTSEDAAEKKALKKKMYETIDASPDKDFLRTSIDEANIKLMQHMRKMSSQITEVLKENRSSVLKKEVTA
jgi:hypothetical protein